MEDSSRFLCDHMLGTLARWLRLLGYDTSYPGALEDDELLDLAQEEGRILLTRDKGLANRPGAPTLYVSSDELDAQVRQVLLDLRPTPGDPMNRCSVCNGLLRGAARGEVRGKVPEGVRKRHDQFWRCGTCGRHYWQGTHWDRMRPQIEAYVSLLHEARRTPSRPDRGSPSKA